MLFQVAAPYEIALYIKVLRFEGVISKFVCVVVMHMSTVLDLPEYTINKVIYQCISIVC